MEGPYPIPEIPDDEWDNLPDAEQDLYNRKIAAKNEYTYARDAYNSSMSFLGPAALMVLAAPAFVLSPILAAILGIFAILWAIVRVISRSHAYQRYRDAEKRIGELFA